MNWSTFLQALFVLCLFNSTSAETTGSSSSSSGTTTTATTTSTTLVWVTGTVNGVTTVTQSPYTQVFTSLFTTVSSVPSGSIGVGSISDASDVGKIRTYSETTISANAAPGGSKNPFTGLSRGLSGSTAGLVAAVMVSVGYVALI